jgi:hypothetical protein
MLSPVARPPPRQGIPRRRCQVSSLITEYVEMFFYRFKMVMIWLIGIVGGATCTSAKGKVMSVEIIDLL